MDVIEVAEHELTRLVRTPHPLTTQGQTSLAVLQRDGETLASLLERHQVDAGWVVEVGGLEVPHMMWGRVRVHHGQVIECRRTVQKDVVRIIAFAALAYFTMGAGAAAFLPAGVAAGSLTASIIGAVAFAAGAMVINRLLPPAAPKTPAERQVSPSYSLSGGRNGQRLWQPMGLVLGQPYAVPDLASQSYTYFAGEDQFLVQVFHLGINCHRVDSVRIGQTALSTYQDVTLTARGLPGNSYGTGLPSTNVDTVAGALLDAPTAPGPWVVRTTSAGTVRICVDVEATLYATTNDGGWASANLDLAIEYAVAGSGLWQALPSGTSRNGVSAPAGEVWLTGSSSKPVRVSVQLMVPAGQYDVRLRKLAVNATDTRSQNAVTWTALRSFQAEPAGFPGQSVLAMVIKASGQLSGSVDEFNCVLTAKPCPHWDGSAWVTATDRSTGLSNPGTILLAYARGFYDENGRLMAGLGWPDSRINIESLKAFTVWCTQRGFTFDLFQQDPISHAELMESIAYAGMGSIDLAIDGRVAVQWLDPDAPVEGVINMGNIKAKSFSVQYDTADRADEIEYGYFDRAKGNSWTSLRVAAPGVAMPRSTARLPNPGITSEAHAAVLARHAMAQNIYMAKAISFEQDLEYLTYRRGTVLALSHDLTQWGYSGRLQAVNVSAGVVTLTLDDDVPAISPSGSANRFIGLRLLGERQYRVFQVQAFSGSSRSVQLVGAWPAGVPLPGTSGQVHDALWIYDFKATPGQRVVVSRIEPGDSQSARITVVPLPSEFWPYVWTGAYTPPPNNSLLSGAAPSVQSASVSEVLKRQGNTFATDLVLSLRPGPNTASVEVWGAAGGELLRLLGTTSTGNFAWTGGLDEVWALRLVPYSALGRPGAAYTLSYGVQGLRQPPAAVTGLDLVLDGAGVRVRWAPSADVDYSETELRVGASWASSGPLVRKAATSHLMAWLPAGTHTVWAAHVDTTGNTSTPVSASLTVQAPGVAEQLVLSLGTASVEAAWKAPVVGAYQQPLDRVELSWSPTFATVIDGKRATTATFGWLPAGLHVLYARYVDVAGNVGGATQATLEVLPPAQPVMTAVETQINAVTLRWQDAKTSQPIRKYAIYYADAGTALAGALLYGAAGADSRSDILFYRSSGDKLAWLVAEDVAGNLSAPRQIEVAISMPNNFVLATEYYHSWDSAELTNAVIEGGPTGQIILPANPTRTWGQRLSNNGWTTAQQKIDAGFPIVMQPVPASGKHVERRDVGKLLSAAVVRVKPTVLRLVPGATPVVRIRASAGDTQASWQPWLTGDAASFANFRYVEVEYSVVSDGKGFVVLDDLYVAVEVSELTESAVLTLNAADAAGTVYTASKPFLDVRTAVATPLASPNLVRLNVVIDDAVAPAKVLVQAWDTNNNRASGVVSLQITGVTS